ncbi:MAG: ABC transporter ATP-binding protein [Cellulosilyticaceae bacterium]
MTVKQGSIYGLLGPNGSGKSTLIHVLTGLLPFDQGNCYVFEQNMKHRKKLIQKKIGLVPQEYAFYEDLKAIENVMLFGRLYGLSHYQAQKGTEQALKKVDLWEVRDQFPTQFSGGMKRRLNIACALVHQPPLIIMDEPTASLDPVSRDKVLQYIRGLNEEGCTVIYTSHYLDEVEAICDDVAILNKGRVLRQGTLDDVKKMIPYTHEICLIGRLETYIIKQVIVDLPIKRAGEKMCIQCNGPQQVLEKLLPILRSQGIRLKDITVRRISLEELFLKIMQ